MRSVGIHGCGMSGSSLNGEVGVSVFFLFVLAVLPGGFDGVMEFYDRCTNPASLSPYSISNDPYMILRGYRVIAFL